MKHRPQHAQPTSLTGLFAGTVVIAVLSCIGAITVAGWLW